MNQKNKSKDKKETEKNILQNNYQNETDINLYI